ncbi:MAG: relaxase/mobilization nuclease domain-containing protein [Firmicutes bacterium]|nr:relaxase/mobilization nuclease domain-containing protein [Bacillota bacterium]
MATTSIWSVKGWLGRVVVYAENPAKTENPAFFEKQGMTWQQAQGLADVIDYAVQERKTVQKESPVLLRQFVSGVNCQPDTARSEMLRTKRLHDKEGGVVAYHGYQSFAPGESSPELAHKIGVRLAEQLWGERFEVLVATHLDKANHIHNHFVVNTVSFVDGFRYYRSEKDYYNMRQASDDLCREYGLSVIEQPQPGQSRHYAEWQATQQGKPTYHGMMQADLDRAIAWAMTERQFFDNLRAMGYSVKRGEDITVRAAGRDRGLKIQRNFGDDYSLESIRRRILEQARPRRPEPEPTRQVRVFLLRGTFQHTRRLKGFRALYFHYLYLLGKLPRHRQRPPEKVRPVYRGELIKIDQISRELRLLCEHEIDTPEQLAAFKKTASKKAAALCDRILFRAQEMHRNMQTDKKESEVNRHEFRRRSR